MVLCRFARTLHSWSPAGLQEALHELGKDISHLRFSPNQRDLTVRFAIDITFSHGTALGRNRRAMSALSYPADQAHSTSLVLGGLDRLARGSLRARFSVLCRLARAPREQVRMTPTLVTKTARANRVFYHRHLGGLHFQAWDGCGQKEKRHGRLGDSLHVGPPPFFLPVAVPIHWGTKPLCAELFGRGEYIRDS